MDITFSYQIVHMVKAPTLGDLQDVVTKVGFTYSGELEDGTKVTEPMRVVDLPAPDAENFKPLGELTEAEVIAWVEATYPIGPVTESITQRLNDIVNPKEVVSELPWATPVEE